VVADPSEARSTRRRRLRPGDGFGRRSSAPSPPTCSRLTGSARCGTSGRPTRSASKWARQAKQPLQPFGAQAGPRLLAEPERVREAFRSIETTGREALVELRRLLGVLRGGEEHAATSPQPGLASLEALLGQVREAGLRVDLRVEGEPVALPAGVDLSAYRIVQEALTNALKHAGRAEAEVIVRYDAAAVELEILDNGIGPHTRVNGSGHGLVGMRERVALYGGVLEAGSRSGHGFVVRARLPLASQLA
jgi:signal transduction histidine kinase